MALNTLKCNRVMTLGFEGLTIRARHRLNVTSLSAPISCARYQQL